MHPEAQVLLTLMQGLDITYVACSFSEDSLRDIEIVEMTEVGETSEYDTIVSLLEPRLIDLADALIRQTSPGYAVAIVYLDVDALTGMCTTTWCKITRETHEQTFQLRASW